MVVLRVAPKSDIIIVSFRIDKEIARSATCHFTVSPDRSSKSARPEKCVFFLRGVEFNGDVRWASKEAEHLEI